MMSSCLGSLTVGKQAEIILIRATDLSMIPRNNAYGAIVYNAHAGMVDTVLVAGRVVKDQGRLLHVDVERIRRLALETNDYLFTKAKDKKLIADASRGGNMAAARAALVTTRRELEGRWHTEGLRSSARVRTGLRSALI